MAWGDKRKERQAARQAARAQRREGRDERVANRREFLGKLADKAIAGFGNAGTDEPLTRQGDGGGNNGNNDNGDGGNMNLLLIVAAVLLLPKLMKK